MSYRVPDDASKAFIVDLNDLRDTRQLPATKGRVAWEVSHQSVNLSVQSVNLSVSQSIRQAGRQSFSQSLGEKHTVHFSERQPRLECARFRSRFNNVW